VRGVTLRCTVNGFDQQDEVEARLSLADWLRDNLHLTGTRVGCEQGVCGSCTILVDGLPIRSCLTLAVQVDGADVRTVESLATSDDLHPMQRAFEEESALQCGFCTPGMLMTAIFLLENPGPISAESIREAISGNLCRCTGYAGIVRAILRAAREDVWL